MDGERFADERRVADERAVDEHLIADHVLLRLVHCKLPRRLVVFDQEEVGTDLAVVLFKVSVEGKEHLVLVGQGAFLLALLLKYRLEYVANRMRCDAISCEME